MASWVSESYGILVEFRVGPKRMWDLSWGFKFRLASFMSSLVLETMASKVIIWALEYHTLILFFLKEPL